MTDFDISKALAIAIGWRHLCYVITEDGERKVCVCITPNDSISDEWRIFDYRDWDVIGPIAKRYGMVVDFYANEAWRNGWSKGDTPQKAIALAVIGAKT